MIGTQLVFDLPARTALGREDFYISKALKPLIDALEQSQNWPNAKLILFGPAKSGKTHLTHVWEQICGARRVTLDQLPHHDPIDLAKSPLIIEDIPLAAGDETLENALFHLFNATKTAGCPLLLTGQEAPRLWRFALADLQSRIDGAMALEIPAPDDLLLRAVLIKLFADRQLYPPPNLIAYLTTRMERSLHAAQEIVAQIDQSALAQKRDISRSLAAAVLEEIAANG